MEHSLMQEVEQLREHQSHQIAGLAAQAAQNHGEELRKHAKKVMVDGRPVFIESFFVVTIMDVLDILITTSNTSVRRLEILSFIFC